jgi:hypothetical protein
MSYEQTESNSGSGLSGIRHHEIAELAYQLWIERGSPEGSPEEDWHRAELEIALNLAADSNPGSELLEEQLETAA